MVQSIYNGAVVRTKSSPKVTRLLRQVIEMLRVLGSRSQKVVFSHYEKHDLLTCSNSHITGSTEINYKCTAVGTCAVV